MASQTNQAIYHSSSRHDPENIRSTVDEQQALLQSNSDPFPATKPEGRNGDVLASVLVWVSYSVFALTTWVIVFSSNDPVSFGWLTNNAFLQSISLGCFSYGIFTLQPTSQPHTRGAALRRHQIATIGFGIPLMLAGTLAIFLHQKENRQDASHIMSWHGASTVGMITGAWIIVQALFGGSTVWFDGAAWGGEVKAKAMWKYHRLSGYILFPFLLLTAHLGGGNSEPFVRLIAYTIAPCILLVGVYLRIRPSKMKLF